MIPRILHQVWLGPNPLPDEYAGYAETWQRLHPAWEYRLWTEDDIPDDVRPEVHERLRVPAERSDLLRLELVVRYGGVYIDTDFECLQPLDPLLEGVDLFAAYLRHESEEARINNAIFGATPQHPVLVRALAEARPRDVFGYDKNAAGPMFLDRMLKGTEATLFDRRLFYPKQIERDGAVAFHHQARTWKDTAGMRRSLGIARRRCEATRFEVRELETRVRLAESERSPARRAAWKAFRARKRARKIERKLRYRAGRARRVARDALGPRWERVRARTAGAVHGRSGMVAVPRMIHQIWLDGSVPNDVTAQRQTWRLANPGWQLRLWTEADIPGDVRAEARERLRSPAERADLLRLEILRRHGGVVVEPGLTARPLAPLLQREACLAAAAADGRASTTVVGAVPGHPAITAAIDAQRPREWSGYDAEATGAGALERVRADGAEIALVRGFEDAAGGDSAAERAALHERVLAAEAELAALEERVAELRGQLEKTASTPRG